MLVTFPVVLHAVKFPKAVKLVPATGAVVVDIVVLETPDTLEVVDVLAN